VAQFDHERLDVYRVSIAFVALADDTIGTLPRGRAYLADQFHRAALSIPLNIAEGAGERSPKDKKRFYRMALRSATECAAILDVCRHLKPANEEQPNSGRDSLLRVVSMLTRMTKESGTGTTEQDDHRTRSLK
jgi:four helix bundle protein